MIQRQHGNDNEIVTSLVVDQGKGRAIENMTYHDKPNELGDYNPTLTHNIDPDYEFRTTIECMDYYAKEPLKLDFTMNPPDKHIVLENSAIHVWILKFGILSSAGEPLT